MLLQRGADAETDVRGGEHAQKQFAQVFLCGYLLLEMSRLFERGSSQCLILPSRLDPAQLEPPGHRRSAPPILLSLHWEVVTLF